MDSSPKAISTFIPGLGKFSQFFKCQNRMGMGEQNRMTFILKNDWTISPAMFNEDIFKEAHWRKKKPLSFYLFPFFHRGGPKT